MLKGSILVLLTRLALGARLQVATNDAAASDEFDAADEFDSSEALEVSDDIMDGDGSLDALLNDSAADLVALENWGEDEQPKRGIWEKSGGSWYPKGKGLKCPDECLYCCKFGISQSKDRFYCITKYGLSCPKGRKCRVYFRTTNKKEYEHYTPSFGIRQRAALGAYIREVYYTDKERKTPPSLTKCPKSNTVLTLNYQWVNRVKAYDRSKMAELGMKPANEGWPPPEQKPVDDGGWVPVPKKKKGEFQCPHECLECCSSGWHNQFTCIMRGEDMPDSHECSTPSMRSKTDGYKTSCKFTDEERKLPGRMRKMGQCADRYRCCCPMDDHWTEEVCLPHDTPDQIWMKSSRGTTELFRYVSHMEEFENRGSRCRRGGVGLGYHRPAPLSGCCLQRHQYCCRMCKYGCCGWCWQCDRFEKLNTCSDDYGVTKSGKIFARAMSQLGTCFPNKGDVDSSILRLNNPDSNGNIRMVPLPPITGGMNKGKPRKTALENNKECPLGTVNVGADFFFCQCKSDKPKCGNPSKSRQSLLEINETSALTLAENDDFDSAEDLETQEHDEFDSAEDLETQEYDNEDFDRESIDSQ